MADTDKALADFKKVVRQHKGHQDSLIMLLQEAERAFGYLPRSALESIADSLGLTLSKVYGAATFYAQFHFEPSGRHKVRVCCGTACHVKGAHNILQKLEDDLGVRPKETTQDERFTLESVACLGACAIAPVVVIDDDYHPQVTKAEIGRLLEGYD